MTNKLRLYGIQLCEKWKIKYVFKAFTLNSITFYIVNIDGCVTKANTDFESINAT